MVEIAKKRMKGGGKCYGGQPLICDGLFRPRRSAPVKLECAGVCTNWGECYRSIRGLLVVVSIGLVFNVELSLNKL